jgi:hypothetical protein
LSKARSKAIATDLDKQQDNFKSRLKDWMMSKDRS